MKKDKIKLIRNIIIILVVLALIFYFKMKAGDSGYHPFDGVMAFMKLGG